MLLEGLFSNNDVVEEDCYGLPLHVHLAQDFENESSEGGRSVFRPKRKHSVLVMYAVCIECGLRSSIRSQKKLMVSTVQVQLREKLRPLQLI